MVTPSACRQPQGTLVRGGDGEDLVGWSACHRTLHRAETSIITGSATSGLSQDVVPQPYRSTGIDVLLDRGLITTTAHGYRPRGDLQPQAGPLAVLTHLCAVD
jgi:hypothetical protein